MSNKNGPGGKTIIVVISVLCVLVTLVQIVITPSEPVYPAPTGVKDQQPAATPKATSITHPTEQPKPIRVINQATPTKRRSINIQDIEPVDEAVAHPWDEVEPTARELRLCRDMQLTPVSYTNKVGEKAYDLFSLNLYFFHNGQQYPIEHTLAKRYVDKVRHELKANLNTVYAKYIEWFGDKPLSKTIININITSSREQYISALLDNGAEDSLSSLGVYLPWKHEAFVNLPTTNENWIDHASFISTLTHEATHAINFVQFGYMHRWAQEGLAEYFEFLASNNNRELAVTYKDWQARTEGLGEPFSFSDLIFQNDKWSQNKGALYTTSLVYMQYFSSLPHDKNPLIKVLSEEMLPRCSTLDKSITVDMLDNDGLLASNLYEWFSHNVIHSNERETEWAEKIKTQKK
jgi:hypothetical protein